MPKLRPVALWVSPDEPCYSLKEVELQSPGSKGWHRYQIVLVVRGDRLAEYRVDLGPRERWPFPCFVIPGAVPVGNGRVDIIETVGRLQFLAEEQRGRPPVEAQYPELFPGLDLKKRALDTLEQRIARKRRRSVNGPFISITR